MSSYLEALCQHYGQDFDLVFEKDTDPIDLFCRQHDVKAQQELLREMVEFYEGTQCGRNSLADLVSMGLEYRPGNRESFDWFRKLIEYLSEKSRTRMA